MSIVGKERSVMLNGSYAKKLYLIFAALLMVGALVGYAVANARSTVDETDVYRVELVPNDPYKVQNGLNALAKQGWYYVSSISRSDGKVLLVLRKEY
jgi:hypothetical protein